MARNQYGADGTLDRMLRLNHRQRGVPAIFIHAGAGFHSHQNEHVHLAACVSAAEMGMKFLKAGATATEAVEAALRVLEDKEITNAGYGSNLSIDGTVECDATIVDHLGRSGACGAVPNIRNPISLAKLILDTSSLPLSLRRVPPNALVGEGARAFAEEHGMLTCANEYLVSKNSRDRFFRWQEDLLRAEEKLHDARADSSSHSASMGCVPCQYDTASSLDTGQTYPRDHTAAILAGTWNEGQPDSPYGGTLILDSPDAQDSSVFSSRNLVSAPTSALQSARVQASRPTSGPRALAETSYAGQLLPQPQQYDNKVDAVGGGAKISEARRKRAPEGLLSVSNPFRDGSSSPKKYATLDYYAPTMVGNNLPILVNLHGAKRPLGMENQQNRSGEPVAKRQAQSNRGQDDIITDTIGAIAIDDEGRIAAGSSSGGIGMKHRGRLGPAALVGIGTAVVPCSENDEEGVTVAAVTSGTGEHMATTMASQRCAERIYNGTRRDAGGQDVKDDDEDAIMESFIAHDFMNHPGVRGCNSQGAIGIMVVKKCRTGYYLYFAHNTDSFALASMGALEKDPRCTMSRLPDGAKIAKGGRKIRIF
ncbi:uncharacterized protein UV8b_00696 [Ustilaginoidea virens]|uniref:Asparaginase family protein n=1 Tax=Ustilaginoidea virens TaxID=1159556 RepID=A0A8E5HJK5_USTVR|nr:uncharacterized protein UV8b_00696 [Ustilaginoidea virens]QUC16455.1 hypothetical protein UV8b_00696 [Ustilaginoidea virens]